MGDAEHSSCPLLDWIAERQGALLRFQPGSEHFEHKVDQADIVICDSTASPLASEAFAYCHSQGKPVLVLNEPLSARHLSMIDQLATA